jgi:phage major head subunit gpT-like protein
MAIQNIQAIENKYIEWNSLFENTFRNSAKQMQLIAQEELTDALEVRFPYLDGGSPRLAKWERDRSYSGVSAKLHSFHIEDYQSGMTIPRPHLEAGGNYLISYDRIIQNMAVDASADINQAVFEFLVDGLVNLGPDGQPFFSTTHEGPSGTTQANYVDGAGPVWFLMSASPSKRPIIYAERIAPGVDEAVPGTQWFTVQNNEYLFPLRASYGMTYYDWRAVAASKVVYSENAQEQLRLLLKSYRSKENRKLAHDEGLILIVPPEYEKLAKEINTAELVGGGDTNVVPGFGIKVVSTSFIEE